VPNPDLQPETSDGFELGLRLQGRAVTLGASVFRTDYRDFIESKVNIGVDPVSGYTLFQSRNVAEARIVGVEMDARIDAAALAPSLRGWTGRVAASWVRGDDLTRDEPLNSIDPPQAVLGARYEAASARWAVELILTAVEAQRRVDESAADLYQTDGYATVDLVGQWRVADRVRLDVGLFNVTDAEYIEWSDVRGRAADDVLVPYYTRPGFNASATLRYDF
jgi:hemoglobin/transferrin/lactoferrin receptor protein